MFKTWRFVKALSNNTYEITLGIEDLDLRYGDLLKFGTTIVIFGKPGCGKTVLASFICYKNALKESKCLYISMNEFEDEFIYYMKKLNMNFAELSGKSFKFVNALIPAGEEAARDLIQQISELITEFKPKVIVIDSINPLLRAIKSTERRAWMQNFFKSIPRIINGLLILVVEDPGSAEEYREVLLDIVYPSSLVINLRSYIRRGFIYRRARFVKVRGGETQVVEVPFTIRSGVGIELWYPPQLMPEASFKDLATFKLPCRMLNEALDCLRTGESIYIGYANLRPIMTNFIPIVTAAALINKRQALVVSYTTSPDEWALRSAEALKDSGVDESLVERVIEEVYVVKSVNPAGLSIEELYAIEAGLVKTIRPGIAIFWEVHAPMMTIGARELHQYLAFLRNQLILMKNQGVTVLRVGTFTDEKTFMNNASLSDYSIRYEALRNGVKISLYPKYRAPISISGESLKECVKECVEYINTSFEKH